MGRDLSDWLIGWHCLVGWLGLDGEIENGGLKLQTEGRLPEGPQRFQEAFHVRSQLDRVTLREQGRVEKQGAGEEYGEWEEHINKYKDICFFFWLCLFLMTTGNGGKSNDL